MTDRAPPQLKFNRRIAEIKQEIVTKQPEGAKFVSEALSKLDSYTCGIHKGVNLSDAFSTYLKAHGAAETTVPDALSESDEDEDKEEYEVEYIAQEREVGGKKQYRVKWVGWSYEDDTWA